MYKTKLCLGVNPGFGLSTPEQIRLFRKIGFEGFFTSSGDNVEECRRLADELGMIFQSIHAPFGNSAYMWKNDEDADDAVEELLECVDECAGVNVPILVMHTYIGFEPSEGPTPWGIENYRKVVEAAKSKNVKIAFENTEGEEYLDALMKAFDGCDNVGFCWDTGHELCYNRGKDMTALYGDRLICTHLNDNLGVRDFNGKITFHDDLHLLPFDGITDWKSVADRLNKCGYNGILTFELNTKSKPDRHENDKYAALGIEQYISECYARACRLAYMKNGMD